MLYMYIILLSLLLPASSLTSCKRNLLEVPTVDYHGSFFVFSLIFVFSDYGSSFTSCANICANHVNVAEDIWTWRQDIQCHAHLLGSFHGTLRVCSCIFVWKERCGLSDAYEDGSPPSACVCDCNPRMLTRDFNIVALLFLWKASLMQFHTPLVSGSPRKGMSVGVGCQSLPALPTFRQDMSLESCLTAGLHVSRRFLGYDNHTQSIPAQKHTVLVQGFLKTTPIIFIQVIQMCYDVSRFIMWSVYWYF